ncbi:MAG: uL13 family ribosomal protein [Candidatus Kerfeldbacteria bacterium]
MTKDDIIKYEVDAEGEALGRVATKVATYLLGKNLPSYQPNKVANVLVEISNIDKVKTSQKKLKDTIIYTHSGYPGGLKEKKWMVLFNKNPELLFMKVVNNMVPSNRLKKEILKNIKFVK